MRRRLVLPLLLALALSAVVAVPANAAPGDATVTGTFVDGNGEALDGMEVYIEDATVVTDEDGRFSYTAPPPSGGDSWFLFPAQNDGYEEINARVTAGMITDLGEIGITSRPGITGRVETSKPRAYTIAYLIDEDGHVAGSTNVRTGMFRFSYRQKGEYTVRVSREGSWGYLGDTARFERADFTKFGPTSTKKLVIDPPTSTGSLQGRISQLGEGDPALAKLSIRRTAGSDVDVITRYVSPGKLTVPRVPAGRYRIAVTSSEQPDAWYAGPGKALAATAGAARPLKVTAKKKSFGTIPIPIGYFTDSLED